MSARLDQEREAELQPQRMETCKATLEQMGYEVESDQHTKLTFVHDGSKITLYPYSGWFTGKPVKDGRGFKNLINQLRG